MPRRRTAGAPSAIPQQEQQPEPPVRAVRDDETQRATERASVPLEAEKPLIEFTCLANIRVGKELFKPGQKVKLTAEQAKPIMEFLELPVAARPEPRLSTAEPDELGRRPYRCLSTIRDGKATHRAGATVLYTDAQARPILEHLEPA